MDVEITPEPTLAERAAIEAAVADALAEPSAIVNRWWRAGLADASDEDELEPLVTTSRTP